jgi:hypothetical protein
MIVLAIVLWLLGGIMAGVILMKVQLDYGMDVTIGDIFLCLFMCIPGPLSLIIVLILLAYHTKILNKTVIKAKKK